MIDRSNFTCCENFKLNQKLEVIKLVDILKKKRRVRNGRSSNIFKKLKYYLFLFFERLQRESTLLSDSQGDTQAEEPLPPRRKKSKCPCLQILVSALQISHC